MTFKTNISVVLDNSTKDNEWITFLTDDESRHEVELELEKKHFKDLHDDMILELSFTIKSKESK